MSQAGFLKTHFFRKAQPGGFFGFYWVLGFIVFFAEFFFMNGYC